MRISMTAACLLLAAFVLHCIVWRIRRPRRQTLALLTIFIAVLAAGLGGIALLPYLNNSKAWGFWPCFQIALFHVGMTFMYVVLYNGVEGVSPSMSMLIDVDNSKGQGRTEQELCQHIQQGQPIDIRLEAMARNDVITQSDGFCRLTPKGMFWARIFSTWRKVSSLPPPG